MREKCPYSEFLDTGKQGPEKNPNTDTFHAVANIFFFTITTYTRSKSKIHSYVKCLVRGISTSKNLFKEIEKVNSNAPVRSTTFE